MTFPELRQAALDLCHKIEGCGASPELTAASLQASNLRQALVQAEAAHDKLRQALVGLVGAETAAELDGMEAILRLAPIPESDRAGMINAINALRDTAPAPAAA